MKNPGDPYECSPVADDAFRDSPTGIRWQVFALACGTSFLLYLHRYSWNIVGPLLDGELGLSRTESGLLFSLFYYTYACGQIPAGRIVDRFGPRRFLTFAIIGWSGALAAISVAGQLVIVAGAARLMFGAAQAGCYPALTRVTRVWFPDAQRTTIQGWIATTSGRAGAAVSPILMATLLLATWNLPWRLAVLLLSALGLLFAVVFLTLFRNSPAEDPRVNEAERRLIPGDLIPPGVPDPPSQPGKAAPSPGVLPLSTALQNRSIRAFTVQQFLDAGSDVAFVSLIGAYFLQSRGLNLNQTGWLASLPLWGGALGGIAGGALNDFLIRATGNRRFARSLVGCAGKLAGGGLLLLVIQAESALAAGLLLMAAKFFSDWSQPTTWGACTDLGGRFSATVFSIVNTAGTLGGIVMPLLFGAVLDWFTTTYLIGEPPSPRPSQVDVTNWSPLFVVLSLMYFGSGLCWLLVDCTRRLDMREVPAA